MSSIYVYIGVDDYREDSGYEREDWGTTGRTVLC